ncbi:3-carboxy-cis,cis-muconate cycloisomerase [Streptosporangium becharense]|uniref:3-carboxy-cis,cis-muconate cycloisomerase n=1 Tax=Streptosporangium becharense TaxID=1816182 RepID=A0A7W9ICL0_9ACTN|nr:adenylosuccinate lyase family protein [Streptosporangium becharense]MBB2913653.1 3-carboxy-cis,cis-muconate cycloisomerase [Streptosporangium becharense]MBB5817734.1 3-carboxy-cis,cis-muconate cycloisomerase [Streptosporangium becharense]
MQTFKLLPALFGDAGMAGIFSAESTVLSWLRVEAALALAQAEAGVIDESDAEAIAAACVPATIDLDRLWREAVNVGYPILPLVRMIAAALPEGPNGRVHYGATTQDIMDSGLSLQMREALERLVVLLESFGDALARLVEEHAGTVVAARTHAQQAVPTTFGAKLAVLLAEVTRQRRRLRDALRHVPAVSLFGAGGTSAAMGEQAAVVRKGVATRLGLVQTDVPWHVARDGIAEFGVACASVAATAARFAREVVDLSRTEVGEVREAGGHHRGASSTMPQKANPIGCEAIIGMSGTAGALSSAVFRAMEAGHERAAGEWQVEWYVVPQLAELAAGALVTAAEVAVGLQVFPEAMRGNLDAEGGLIMAEAYMMRLAPALGREQAHDLVYQAAHRARADRRALADTLREVAGPDDLASLGPLPLPPESYIGDAETICAVALAAWRTEENDNE